MMDLGTGDTINWTMTEAVWTNFRRLMKASRPEQAWSPRDRRLLCAVLTVQMHRVPWHKLRYPGVGWRTAFEQHQEWHAGRLWPDIQTAFLAALDEEDREAWQRVLRRPKAERRPENADAARPRGVGRRAGLAPSS